MLVPALTGGLAAVRAVALLAQVAGVRTHCPGCQHWQAMRLQNNDGGSRKSNDSKQNPWFLESREAAVGARSQTSKSAGSRASSPAFPGRSLRNLELAVARVCSTRAEPVQPEGHEEEQPPRQLRREKAHGRGEQQQDLRAAHPRSRAAGSRNIRSGPRNHLGSRVLVIFTRASREAEPAAPLSPHTA